MGERKFAQTVLITWPRWPPCPYMVKTLEIFSGTKRPMILKLRMHHWVLEYYQVCSNDDPGLTLTYFAARSNLVPYAFVWGKRFKIKRKWHRFEICNKWMKWQAISVDIKTLSPGGCLPLSRRYIHVLNHEEKKMCKIRLQRDFFETCNKWVKW